MTPISPTIARTFTGDLELEGQQVAVSIVFTDGGMRLVLGGDTVGSWPTEEVEFVVTEAGYDLRAEGDSLHFRPHQAELFASFLEYRAGNAAEPASIEPGEEVAVPHTPARDWLAPLVEEDDGGFGPGPDEPQADDNDAATLIVDESPDEFFAAGLHGPPSGPTPPPFAPKAIPTDEGPTVPVPAAPTLFDVTPTPASAASPVSPHAASVVDDPVETPSPRPSVEPEAVSPPPDEVEAAEKVGQDRDPEFDVAPRDGITDSPSPLDVPGHESSDGPDGSEGGIGAAARAFIVGLRTRRTATSPAEGALAADPISADDVDDAPTPMDDTENLRQWGLVVAGGVIVLVVIGLVAWGVVAMLNGDEVVVEAQPTTTVATAPTTTAPSPTTTAAPPATVSPENAAAAAAFVEGWNDLATRYAYHLSISAETLPISTAPAPTVHLTYDGNVLQISAAPKGNGNDRDILVALGLAVAWADPELSPEARKDLLSALGISVDEPRLEDMGGETSRNGITYRASVIDSILRFEIVGA